MGTDEPTRCYAIEVAYDGTRYVGWQTQPNGLAIQQVLSEKIAQVVGHPITLQGSGRTDAGVHAQGQVASFCSAEWKHHPGKLVRAINQHLPKDISVLGCRRVVDGFDPIRNAISKTYRYTIRNSDVPDPLRYAYHWWIPRELDVQAMQAGATKLIGTLDFKAFETLGSTRKTSVRTVRRLDVTSSAAIAGREIWIEIQADGFLYNMVRNITGALVEIGKGRFGPNWLVEMIASKQRDPESQTAPARGLCLMDVQYPRSLYIDSDQDLQERPQGD
jgi:tRNA pseudouridine38-40 synthase